MKGVDLITFKDNDHETSCGVTVWVMDKTLTTLVTDEGTSIKQSKSNKSFFTAINFKVIPFTKFCVTRI